MALGLRLRVTNTLDGSVMERTFDRFPVRIGRNPLSDLALDFPYVSQFHAILELQGQQLMLRDLGSRNGTHLRSAGRVPPHQPVDLGPHNYEFAISTLLFQAYPAEVRPDQAKLRLRGSTFAVDPEQAAQLRGQAFGASAEIKREIKPYYDAYRAAWTQLFQLVSVRAGNLSAEEKQRLLEELAKESPGMAGEADFQRLASFAQARVSGVAVAQGTRNEQMALQAVKELASSYVPNRPLEGPADLLVFLAKLQGVLDVFFKSFIPLRDGYKQFETKMEIRRATMKPNQIAQMSVETAKDPKSLAAGLLDWGDDSNEGPRQIEGTFADLMIHQVAMLDGVMRGVKSLLAELAPPAIEKLAEKKGGLKFGPFRFEQLWKTYAERHSDLADEEKETFGLIFGPQFVKAYTQMSKGDAQDGHTFGTGASATYAGAPPFRPEGR